MDVHSTYSLPSGVIRRSFCWRQWLRPTCKSKVLGVLPKERSKSLQYQSWHITLRGIFILASFMYESLCPPMMPITATWDFAAFYFGTPSTGGNCGNFFFRNFFSTAKISAILHCLGHCKSCGSVHLWHLKTSEGFNRCDGKPRCHW